MTVLGFYGLNGLNTSQLLDSSRFLVGNFYFPRLSLIRLANQTGRFAFRRHHPNYWRTSFSVQTTALRRFSGRQLFPLMQLQATSTVTSRIILGP